MARITVELPSVMDDLMAGERSVALDADTLAGALQALVTAHPQLEVHLFDESGSLRQHVLCFHNQTNSRWLDSLDVPLRNGDAVRFLQAVSGG